jgi:hypothetical protein
MHCILCCCAEHSALDGLPADGIFHVESSLRQVSLVIAPTVRTNLWQPSPTAYSTICLVAKQTTEYAVILNTDRTPHTNPPAPRLWRRHGKEMHARPHPGTQSGMQAPPRTLTPSLLSDLQASASPRAFLRAGTASREPESGRRSTAGARWRHRAGCAPAAAVKMMLPLVACLLLLVDAPAATVKMMLPLVACLLLVVVVVTPAAAVKAMLACQLLPMVACRLLLLVVACLLV